MKLSMVLAGFGAQCSIGLSTPAIAAAVGGTLNRFRFDRRIRSGRTGAQITCAWLETLPEEWMARDRMKALAAAAAAEALQKVPEPARLRIPVLLAMPALRPDFDESAGVTIAREIIRSLPMAPDRHACSMLPEGHAGGLKLLLTAQQLLAEDTAPAVLIGGIESYRDLSALRSIEREGRLRTEDDPLGWIPGEGAAFLLLTTQEGAARLGISATIALDTAATADEERPWYSGEATLGNALTQTLREALAQPGVRVETYCDMNGESWRADEWSYAYLRTAGHYLEPLAMHHPADCWGDVGAASGPMLIALAAQRMLQHRARTWRALVWTASDAVPLRAACTMSMT